jgi:hypothetical protein
MKTTLTEGLILSDIVEALTFLGQTLRECEQKIDKARMFLTDLYLESEIDGENDI